MEAKKNFVVLIAEDDSSLRSALRLLVQRQGFQVLESENGSEALEKVRSNAVHFILSDIQMPKMSGIDLLKEVRNLNPEIPVILLMSGYSGHSKDEALSLGAVDLLPKPNDFSEILNHLNSAYSNWSKGA